MQLVGTQCVASKLPRHADVARILIAVLNTNTGLSGSEGAALSAVVSAAGQRIHAVTGGTWRDALLLSAWQRQHASAAQPGRPIKRPSVAGAASKSASTSSSLSPLLQRVLTVPDAAAAVVSGDISLTGISTSGAAGPRLDVVPAAPRTGHRPRTEFGLYWQPGKPLNGICQAS